MRALVAGILSFLIIYLFDWASIKRVPGGKQAIAFLFLALQGYALYAAWGVERFSLPAGISWLGCFLLPISIVLLLYSLLLEIPFAKTYSDVLYVSVRDRFFFPRMFPDYPQYRRQTPMLIPTRESISACFSTLKAREALR